MISLKSPDDIARMRESGRVAAEVLDAVGTFIRPGVTTAELDRIAYDTVVKAKAKPAFLGYNGYPATICASVNEEVIHGIPSPTRVLKEGDIISVDVGVVYRGFYGDTARTFPVGVVNDEKTRLMDVTRDSLYRGIDSLHADMKLGVLSSTIQRYVESNGFSVVRQFVGHGIGKRMHEEPQVPNFGRPSDGPVLRAGTVLAIEPMVNAGTHRVTVLEDGWTAITDDKRPSAHFEHTVAILSDGVEILTEWKR
jgi:methionyl aminopeptidase